MKKKLRHWLRSFLGINFQEKNIFDIKNLVQNLQKTIGERTTVHCDVHMKEPCEVIVIGRYQNRDYVRCFHLRAESIDQLVVYLGRIEKDSHVGRFDMIGNIPFEAVYPAEHF